MIIWTKKTRKFSNGEDGQCGSVWMFSVDYDSCRSKTSTLGAYRLTTTLPGLKLTLGNFENPQEAKNGWNIKMNPTTADYLAMQSRCSKRPSAPPDAYDGPESDIHRQVSEYCKARRWVCWHGSMVKRTGRTIGEPDFQILADNGRVFFIEIKNKSGKVKPEQAGMILAAKILGHTIHLCRSFEEFLEIVKD